MANTDTILAESGLVSALYGAKAAAAQATGNAQAEETEATGDILEGGAYTTAAGIAKGAAQIATVSGQIQQAQNTRAYLQTIGAQKAAISGAGFAQSGSALSLARSSLQQGLLQNQVLGVNAQLQSQGYLQQAQASTAEATAATTASSAAQQLAQSDISISAIDTANANTVNADLSNIAQTTGVNALEPNAPIELGGRVVSSSNPFVI
jgi:hypothetical protein